MLLISNKIQNLGIFEDFTKIVNFMENFVYFKICLRIVQKLTTIVFVSLLQQNSSVLVGFVKSKGPFVLKGVSFHVGTDEIFFVFFFTLCIVVFCASKFVKIIPIFYLKVFTLRKTYSLTKILKKKT